MLAYLNGIPTWTASTTLSTITGTLGIANGGTATTTFYNGGITFYNSSLGTLSQAGDGKGLFWDETNKRLGVGTSSPAYKLSVEGIGSFGDYARASYFNATSTTATSTFSGGITIGSPALSVFTNGNLRTAAGTATFDIQGVSGRNLIGSSGSLKISMNSSNTLAGRAIQFGQGALDFNTPLMTIQQSGEVGIGTSTPYAQLSIASGATATTTLALRPISAQTANILDIYNTSGTLMSVISAAGNVGIGTTSPYAKLSVVGQAVAAYFTATTSTASTFPYASTTALTVSGNTFLTGLSGPNGLAINASGQVYSAATSTLSTITGTLGIANGGTATTTFYNGGVTFYNSTLGTLSQGTAQSDFFYDVANKKLGIGTSSPQALIHVNRHNDASIAFLASRSGSAPSAFGIDFNSGYTRVGSVADFRVFTGMTVDGSLSSATERLTILSASGKVGIGTTTPSEQLSVAGNAIVSGATGAVVKFAKTNATAKQYNLGVDNDSAFTLFDSTAAVNRLYVTTTGNVGIGDFYAAQTPKAKLDVVGSLAVGYATSDSFTAPTNGAVISGNVGIGTTSPGSLLSVAGDSYTSGFINTSQTTGGYKFSGLLVGYASTTNGATIWGLQAGGNDATTTATVRGTTAFGYKALNATTGATGNSAFGYQAGNAITSGAQNTAIGYQTLNLATTSPGNTAVGYQALAGTVDGDTFSSVGQNTAIGYQTLNDLTTGYRNVAIGYGALDVATVGIGQVAVGYNALGLNTTGDSNTAVGTGALNLNTTGGSNVSLGYSALNSSVTGNNNVGIGFQASYNNGSATSTVVIGYRAGYGAGTLANQGTVAIGYQAGRLLDVGSDYNTMLGFQAGYNNTTGSKNIQIGSWVTSTNANITTGSNNIIIGNEIKAPSATDSNQLNIQNIIFGTGNSGTASTLSTGLIGIGTTTPATTLSVQGNGLFSGTLSVASISATSTISGLFFNASQYGGFQQNSALLGYASTTNTATIWGLGAGGQNATTSATSRGTVAVGYQAFNALTSGANNTAVGYRAGYKTNDQGQNSFFGYEAGAYATTSSQNTAIGYQALKGNTSTFSATLPNTAIGYQALTANTSGYYNTAIGNSALALNTTGSQSVAIGQSALAANTTGSNNAIGYFALSSCTTGCGSNNAFGNTTLQSLTTGQDNTAFGNSSQFRGTTAGANASFGYASLYTNKTGTDNIAFGNDSLRYINNATSSVAIGSGAIAGVSGDLATLQNNVAIGYRAGYTMGTGANNNILIGYQAGNAITTGASNILIGYDIDAQSGTGSNQLSLGNLIFGTGIDGTGTTVSSGNIGIGTTTPLSKLQVSTSGADAFALDLLTGSSHDTGIRIGRGSGANGAGIQMVTGTKDYLGFYVNGSALPAINTTAQLVLTEDGNVGIGTTTPIQKLAVTSASEQVALFRNSGGADSLILFQDTATGSNFPYIGSFGNNLAFGNYGSAAANFGIGSTTPYAKLSVTGAGSTTGVNFQTTNSSNSPLFTILDSGNVGIGTTTPASTELLSIAKDQNNTTSLQIANYDTGSAALAQLKLSTDSGGGQIAAGSASNATWPDAFVVRSFSTTSNGLRLITGAGNISLEPAGNTIITSGNVGIGTTTPAAKLDILGSSGDQLRLRTAGSEYYRLGRNSSTGLMEFYGSQTGYTGYVFDGVDGERMRITSAGYVGIGTTTPGSLLTVGGSALFAASAAPTLTVKGYSSGSADVFVDTATNYGGFGYKSAGVEQWYIGNNATGGDDIAFMLGASRTVGMFLNQSGNLGIGTVSPADRLSVAVPTGTIEIANFSKTQTANDTGTLLALWGGSSGDTVRGYLGFAHTGSGADTSFTGELADALNIRSEGAFQLGTNGNNIRLTVASGGNVGIGEAVPGSKLSVSGGATIGATYDTTAAPTNGLLVEGNVGIGTTNPLAVLDVRSSTGVMGIMNTATVVVGNTAQISLLPATAFTGAYATGPAIKGYLENASTYATAITLNPYNGSTGQFEGMRITSTGNVGIGTTTPTGKLELYTASIATYGLNGTNPVAPNLRLTSSDSYAVDKGGTLVFAAQGSTGASLDIAAISGRTESSASGYLQFSTYTNAVGWNERMRIANSGNVGIGTTTPNNKLTIDAGATPNVSQFKVSANGLGGISALTYSADNAYIGFDVDYNGGHVARSTSIAEIYKGVGLLHFVGSAGNTVGGAATQTNIMSLDLVNARVGIGTTAPGAKLEVNGGAAGSSVVGLFKGDTYGMVGVSRGTQTNASAGINYYTTTTQKWFTGIYENSDNFGFYNVGYAGFPMVIQDTTGYVGIGTTTPGQKFVVQGAIEQWIDSTTNWRTAQRNTGIIGFLGNRSDYFLNFDTANQKVSVGSDADFGSKFNVSGNVTIGATYDATAAPANGLLVEGTVGIGTVSPYSKLSVSGGDVGVYSVGATSAGSPVGASLYLGDSNFYNSGFYNSAPGLSAVYGATSVAGDLAFYTYAGASNSRSEKMRILSSGNVGIGTTSPSTKLEVYGATAGTEVLRLTNLDSSLAGGPFMSFRSDGGSPKEWAYIKSGPKTSGQGDNGFLSFWTRGSETVAERVRIDSSGNVGIGTTTPYTTLAVSASTGSMSLISTSATSPQFTIGTINGGGYGASFTDSTNRAFLSYAYDATNGNSTTLKEPSSGSSFVSTQLLGLKFNTNSTERMRIDMNGNVGIGTTTPIQKLAVTSASEQVALFRNSGGADSLILFQDTATGSNFPYLGSFGNNIAFGNYGGGTGNFGINDTSPDAKLEILQASDAAAQGFQISRSNDTDFMRMYMSAGLGGLADTLIFSSAFAGDVAAIGRDGSAYFAGKMGIGSTTPSAALSVGTVLAVSTVDTSANIFSVATSTGTSYFDIMATGNVGVGTTSPKSNFTVVGAGCFSGGTGSTVACGTTAGSIYYRAANVGTYDVAENYQTSDPSINAGTIASLDLTSGTTITTATPGSIPLGIVSTDPGITLGGSDATANPSLARPIALSGRVPVKVSTANGAIAIGDRLMLSTTTPGVAVKALHSGQTIGIALETYSAPTLGTVETFVSSQYWLAPNDFAVDSTTGAVGIGTTTPVNSGGSNYRLAVGGDIIATGFVNLSEGDSKTDIQHINKETADSFLDTIRGLMVAEYHYKNEPASAGRVGLIAEEAPQIVRSTKGNGIDLYKLLSVAIGGVQSLADKFDALVTLVSELTARVVALENGSGVSGAVSGAVGNISDALQSALTSQSVSIANGTVTATTLVAHKFVATPDASGDAAAGTATIRAGETSVLVRNILVAENSKVFVTFNSNTGNGWYVSNKTEGGFSVSLNAPLQTDASFDYFVVDLATSTPTYNLAPSTSNLPPAPSPAGDSQAPTILMNGNNPATINVGDSYADLGASVTDNVDQNLGITTLLDGVETLTVNLDTTVPGTHTVTYCATDVAGNTASVDRTVIVQSVGDTPEPVPEEIASPTPSGV
ncbi:MAG: immunoglobulin-like domain-containing protein [Candidatus Paceibacterota bacterium]